MAAALTEIQRRQLHDGGYLVLRSLMPQSEMERLNSHLTTLWDKEGASAGGENTYVEPNVRRLANLVDKGAVFRLVYNHPLVLEAVKTVLGQNIVLAMLNAREALPEVGNQRQPFHCDTDRNQNGGKPDANGFLTATAIWLITESNAKNGATRVLPGTHRSGQLPEEVIEDPKAAQKEELVLTGSPGDVCIVNGHTWHCGGANYSDATRRSLLAHYARADIPRDPHRRQHLSPQMKGELSKGELQLLGVES